LIGFRKALDFVSVEKQEACSGFNVNSAEGRSRQAGDSTVLSLAFELLRQNIVEYEAGVSHQTVSDHETYNRCPFRHWMTELLCLQKNHHIG